MRYINFFLLFLFLLPSYSKEIKMSFGSKLPPYVFPSTNTGIELDIIRAALAYKGHTLSPKYFQLYKVPLVFKDNLVDAAMTDLGNDLSSYGFYANPAVLYNNVFITLKENNFIINSPEDLNSLILTSFQGAVKRYPKWLEPVKEKYNYFEQNNQKLQVLVLHKKRVDVILTDINIYKYNVLKLQKERNFQAKDVKYHYFNKINVLNYRPVFKDEKIRDDFNEGLKYIKENGTYEAIYNKYLKEQRN